MEELTLKAERRMPKGSRVAQAVREAGRLPAIIYGHGEEPEAISLVAHEVLVALAHGQRTLRVEVGGQTKPYLIKEVQYDYLAQDPIHMDLARVDLDERVTVNVSIELRGVPKGVHEGGILDHMLANIEVECRVADIPDTLRPVVTELGLNESLRVADLELPEGDVSKTASDERVAMVRVLAAAVEDETEEAAETETEASQPERIGRVRETDEPEEKKKG